MHAEAKLVQNEDESWLQIALQEGNVFVPILQTVPFMSREEPLSKDMQNQSRAVPLYGILATQLMNNSFHPQQQLSHFNFNNNNNRRFEIYNNNMNFSMLPLVSLPQNVNNNLSEIRKRKRNLPQKVRKVRPKVVEGKGSIQCCGMNLKKNCRCKNAALMEYTGPRPTYCAEHIDQDPNSMYSKCKSAHQKTPGDKKGCKQVVLKEFGMCYKHFANYATTLSDREVESLLYRVREILSILEIEAAEAKKDRQDLYQRKNKLIPKYQKIKVILEHKSLSLVSNIGSENAFISSLLEDNPFPQMTGSNEVKHEVKAEQHRSNELPLLSIDDEFSLFYPESKQIDANEYSNSSEQRIIYAMPFNAVHGQNICF